MIFTFSMTIVGIIPFFFFFSRRDFSCCVPHAAALSSFPKPAVFRPFDVAERRVRISFASGAGVRRTNAKTKNTQVLRSDFVLATVKPQTYRIPKLPPSLYPFYQRYFRSVLPCAFSLCIFVSAYIVTYISISPLPFSLSLYSPSLFDLAPCSFHRVDDTFLRDTKQNRRSTSL